MMGLISLNTIALRYRKSLRSRLPWIYKYVQDSNITTFIGRMKVFLYSFFKGLTAGFLLDYFNQQHVLNVIGQGYENLFMVVLLPPIIFERYLDDSPYI